MQKRRRFKQTISLNERLDAEADRLRREARSLPPSARRDDLIRKANQMRLAGRLDQLLASPGLRAPLQD
jgi:hypothetical protein